MHFSWHSLTDKSFFDLHLPPNDDFDEASLPSNERSDEDPSGPVTAIFGAEKGYNASANSKARRSSVLLPLFAQWFTDAFFRSAPFDNRKTTSAHNIDLSQIYGPNEAAESCLRARKDGLLKSEIGKDGKDDLVPLGTYSKAKGWAISREFQDLAYVANMAIFDQAYGDIAEDQRPKLYATGLERGNLTVGNVVMTTLFMREHNDICRDLKTEHPDWSDERLFHTARCINTIILMKIVIEDYVNHIIGFDGLLKFDPSFAEKKDWYRAPWISAEFNLLYRWHGLVPEYFQIGGSKERFRKNLNLFSEQSISQIITAASAQQAGVISLSSTPKTLLEADHAMIAKGREWRLQPYNAYREEFGLKPIKRFDDLTDDQELASHLAKIYGTVDQLEFSVGLFAEAPNSPSLVGGLMSRMVAYDAITQIYTNPLLAKHNFTPAHLTKVGMDRIARTSRLQDVVDRNCSKGTQATFKYLPSGK